MMKYLQVKQLQVRVAIPVTTARVVVDRLSTTTLLTGPMGKKFVCVGGCPFMSVRMRV